jgi:hypothetical protein
MFSAHEPGSFSSALLRVWTPALRTPERVRNPSFQHLIAAEANFLADNADTRSGSTSQPCKL